MPGPESRTSQEPKHWKPTKRQIRQIVNESAKLREQLEEESKGKLLHWDEGMQRPIGRNRPRPHNWPEDIPLPSFEETREVVRKAEEELGREIDELTREANEGTDFLI